MTPRITNQRIVHTGHVNLSINEINVQGRIVTREIVEQKDTVAVLPYDRRRKVAMFVDILRAPVLLKAALPAPLEAPAGLIDPGEDARSATLRKLAEETGLVVKDTRQVATVWSTPGVSTERITLFLAQYDTARPRGDGGGVSDEQGQMKVLERRLPGLIESGAVVDLKTLALLLQLRTEEPDLFVFSRTGG
jgi:nudix-type nucleoside diphosphatase (YffH/AdpP family)